VGDYIQAGGAKGMVEQISIRSLKLRHPRGMVYNIPFGGMGSVQNFSRDYIITKLDFRVRYDVDLEKIRKIVKTINKKISKDKEIGHGLLDSIKSQGVREMDDSAMIMRVKFKTIPGEQFIVRREVYRLMQEAFQENGIEFAHRNVTVYLPDSPMQAGGAGAGSQTGKTDPRLLQAAGAAGAAVIAAEEQKLAEEAAKTEEK
jgi:small-conductance mechanosensitive channel